jgi:hypothetical protein
MAPKISGSASASVVSKKDSNLLEAAAAFDMACFPLGPEVCEVAAH